MRVYYGNFFFLVYGVEFFIPMEVQSPTLTTTIGEGVRLSLDLLEETKEATYV